MVDSNRKRRFLELIEQNQDIVHKICSLYARNADDRKDLSQDIICQFWKSYQSFRGDSKFTILILLFILGIIKAMSP